MISNFYRANFLWRDTLLLLDEWVDFSLYLTDFNHGFSCRGLCRNGVRQMQNHGGFGRGRGVGRDLGVALGAGVADGVGVGVSVAVGVGGVR